MVWRSPARPSQLPDWYSSGVCAGLFLRGVYSLHPDGYVAALLAHRAPLGGHSLGRHPLVTHFLHSGAPLGKLCMVAQVEETVPPEVETFHLMVRRSPAEPS